MRPRKLIPIEEAKSGKPPIRIPCSPFGQIANHQYKPYLARIEDLKKKTNWCEGEDILPFIPNYVMNMTFGTDMAYRLTDLPLHLPNTYYNKEEFAAPTVRILKTACLVFDNGKLVITGGQSANNVIYSAYQYRRQLMQVIHLVKVLNDDGTPMLVTEDELVQPTPPCPIPPNTRPNIKKPVYALTTTEKLLAFKSFNLVNVVGTGIASAKPIDLSLLSKIMVTSSSDWMPELFPGLKFEIQNTHCPIIGSICTCHIFDSGAVVIMGAACDEDVTNGFIFLKCIVKYFINHRVNKTKEISKFQHRINLLDETNELFENMPTDEISGLEKSILEEASIKCFGNYMYEREARENAKNLSLLAKETKPIPQPRESIDAEHQISRIRTSSARVKVPVKKFLAKHKDMDELKKRSAPEPDESERLIKRVKVEPKSEPATQFDIDKVNLFFDSLTSI